jgi:diaminopimelate epimerase
VKAIPFTKASACGNTFLIIEARSIDAAGESATFAGSSLAVLSRRLCNPHDGVGADGVEWLFPAGAEADICARLFNADGSEAEISGNGTRCVAAYIYSRDYSRVAESETPKTGVVVRTGAGLKTCRLIGSQGPTFEFETDMGTPQIGAQLSIEIEGDQMAVGTTVSMGNPHFVIFEDEFQDGWQREAALIGKRAQFPEGANVEYVVVRGENKIEIRLFERGVGETQSSGTGSCAAAVAAIASKRVSSPVTVIAPGGSQMVRWEGRVYLQGPATLICRGEFFV